MLMEAGDWEGLIAACERFGDPRTGGDPQLWHDALDYFARQEGDCTKQVRAEGEKGALFGGPVVCVWQAVKAGGGLSNPSRCVQKGEKRVLSCRSIPSACLGVGVGGYVCFCFFFGGGILGNPRGHQLGV